MTAQILAEVSEAHFGSNNAKWENFRKWLIVR